MQIIEVSSPNHGPRHGGAIDILLFHYTGMESAAAARDWLCDERSGVSAHYLVDEHGGVTALVDEARRAWHAGVSEWAGETDINSRSIGIEVHNPGHVSGPPSFARRQIDAVTELSRAILSRHPIPPERVLAHSDVAPHRKIDPGETFPWDLLAAKGVGLWADPPPPDAQSLIAPGERGDRIGALQTELRRFGYAVTESGRMDADTVAVVTAFQRHFRPSRVDGVVDRSTRVTLDRVIALAGLG